MHALDDSDRVDEVSLAEWTHKMLVQISDSDTGDATRYFGLASERRFQLGLTLLSGDLLVRVTI